MTFSSAISSQRCSRTRSAAAWAHEDIPSGPNAIIRPDEGHRRQRRRRRDRRRTRRRHSCRLRRADRARAPRRLSRACCARASWTTRKSSSGIRAACSFRSAAPATRPILVAAGLALKPGYDWFHPVLSRSRAGLQLGVTPLDMLLAARRRRERPEQRRAADAVPLGQPTPQHRPRLERDGDAAASRGRRGRSRRDLQPRERHSRSRVAAFTPTRSCYVSLGEGVDERRRVLGSAERRLHQTPAGAVPGRGQRLRDLGARWRSRHPAATSRGSFESFPGLHVDSVDGTDFFASLRAMREAAAYVRARQGSRRSSTRASSGPTPTRSPTTSGCTRRRPSARPRRAAIRCPRSRSFFVHNRLATDADLAAIGAELDREIDDAALDALKRAEAYQRAPPPCGSIRRMSIRRRRLSRRPATPEGKPDTMVAAINRTLKDEMARNPRDRGLRRGRRRRQPRGRAAHVVPGKGGVFKVTHGLQRRLRRRSRVQHRHRRGEHRRPRRRHGDARA